MITPSPGWAAGYNSVILVVESSGLRLRLVSYGAINPSWPLCPLLQHRASGVLLVRVVLARGAR